MSQIRKQLEELADSKNAEFSKSLGIGGHLPVLGVRLPQLRALGKRLARQENWREMLDNPNLLSYDTHEEILLRSFLIGYAKMDTDERLRLLNDYIPLVSNWALCDCAVGSLSFKPGDSEKVWDFAARLLRSHEEYRVRFGAVLTCFCLKRAIPLDTLLGELSRADTSEFYAMMGVAWAYAELFKLDNDRVLGFLSERHADLRTTRKALSKICDSLTTTEEYRTRIKEIRKTLK